MNVPMKYAASFINGCAFKPDDWGNSGLPIVRIAQLTGGDFDNYFNGAVNPRHHIDNGDLLFAWSATLDSFVWQRGPAYLNQHTFKVVPKTGNDRQFLYYSLKHYAPLWADIDAHGSTTRHIKRESLSNKVWLPDLDTQVAIAAYLDRETARIDQLIAKKERQANLLAELIEQISHEAVTLGLRKGIPNKETKIPWLPNLPAHWQVQRAKHLFKEMARPPLDDDGVITAFRDGQVTLRTKRRTDGFTLAILETGYQHIERGDLVIHSMDAFAGAIGVSEDDGKATGEYVVCAARTNNVSNDYYAILLRCMAKRNYIFVLCPSVRERAPRFRYVRFAPTLLPVPPIEEQRAIVEQIKASSLKLAKQRTLTLRSLTLLKERRAALITAAVTGQLDISEKLPAVTAKSDRAKFRLIVGAEIVHRHQANPKFGRVKLQKELYLAEAHVGISELDGNYLREAAGPLDRALIDETERALEAEGFYRKHQPDGTGTLVTYAPLSKAGQHADGLNALLGPRADTLRSLINLLRDLDKEAVEAVATLYAVWNDALIDGQQPDDAAIVNGVLTEWHAEKRKKFTVDDLSRWLGWMKRQELTPRGQGPKTTMGRLFV